MAKIVPSFSRLISKDALDSAVHNRPRPASINHPKPHAGSDDAVVRASARPLPASVDLYGPRPTNVKPKAKADEKPVPTAASADVYYPAQDAASADADIAPSAVDQKKK